MKLFYIQKIPKLIKLIQQSCKVQDQDAKISCVFMYHQCTRQKGNEENYSFIIAHERIQYLGNNLTKEVKDLDN